MRRNKVKKISCGQSMQNFVKNYQFVLTPANPKRFPTKFLKKLSTHQSLSHLRQFLPLLYGQRPDVPLMLTSSYPKLCHYIAYAKYIFFQRFPRYSEFKSFKKVYPSPALFQDVNDVFVQAASF